MRVAIIIVALILVYSAYKLITESHKYIAYLKSVGIPDNILSKMNAKEIKASAVYLKRYAKTSQHFIIGDKDYTILSSIRTKYGIFS